MSHTLIACRIVYAAHSIAGSKLGYVHFLILHYDEVDNPITFKNLEHLDPESEEFKRQYADRLRELLDEVFEDMHTHWDSFVKEGDKGIFVWKGNYCIDSGGGYGSEYYDPDYWFDGEFRRVTAEELQELRLI